MIRRSHVLSPIRYDQVSPDQLCLMLVTTAILTAVIAAITAVSWRRLPHPKPRLLSYASVCHLLLFGAAAVFCVACIIGAAVAYGSR